MLKFNFLSPTILYPLCFALIFITACHAQDGSNSNKGSEQNDKSFAPIVLPGMEPDYSEQIAEYVVEIFEDKDGNLWFGTMSRGAARYDGKTLTYITLEDGLAGNTVASIRQDKAGNMWFGTHSGLSKYDGIAFTNYSKKEGLIHERVSNILIDKIDNIWVGTWGGVSQFNGFTFSNFPIPNPEVELMNYQSTMDWITEIVEDKEGNIWFGRDGYGACKYDGTSFTHFTKKDGISSNNVQAIQADKQGNIWIGTRVTERDAPDANERTGAGGLSRYDGQTFTKYPAFEGLSGNDVYSIHEDKAGNIWVSSTNHGLFKYDGKEFTNFVGMTGFASMIGGIQAIIEDKNGTLWVGCSGGLFRFNGADFINVTKAGPWE